VSDRVKLVAYRILDPEKSTSPSVRESQAAERAG